MSIFPTQLTSYMNMCLLVSLPSINSPVSSMISLFFLRLVRGSSSMSSNPSPGSSPAPGSGDSSSVVGPPVMLPPEMVFPCKEAKFKTLGASGLVSKGVRPNHCDKRVWGSIPSSDYSQELLPEHCLCAYQSNDGVQSMNIKGRTWQRAWRGMLINQIPPAKFSIQGRR